jgi:uncharacterized protein YgfB (UPF0149 family)
MSDKLEGNVTLEQLKKEYEEAIDIFPALHKYQDQHNTANLQKLCVEVVEFVRAIYSSTQNEQEREILRKHLDKLHNL